MYYIFDNDHELIANVDTYETLIKALTSRYYYQSFKRDYMPDTVRNKMENMIDLANDLVSCLKSQNGSDYDSTN